MTIYPCGSNKRTPVRYRREPHLRRPRSWFAERETTLRSNDLTWKQRDAFGFVSPDDEPVIRKFFVDMIERFGELIRKERGK